MTNPGAPSVCDDLRRDQPNRPDGPLPSPPRSPFPPPGFRSPSKALTENAALFPTHVQGHAGSRMQLRPEGDSRSHKHRSYKP